MPLVRLRSSSTIAPALSSDPGSKGTKTLPLAPVWGNSPATAMTASSGIASAAASTRSVALTAVSLGVARRSCRDHGPARLPGADACHRSTFVDSARRSADARSNALLVASRYASPYRWSGSR